MFRRFINSSNSLFDLILQIPLSSLVGPEIKVAGGRKGRPSLSWMVSVDLNLRNVSVKRRIERASGRRE